MTGDTLGLAKGLEPCNCKYKYCIVLSKRPWVLAAQAPKIGGGPLHREPARMLKLPPGKRPPWLPNHTKPCFLSVYIKLGMAHTQVIITLQLLKIMSEFIIDMSTTARHFYFNRIVLLWNSVQPAINLNEPFQVVRYKLINFLWSHFMNHFNPLDTCTFHLVCPCSNCHASGRFTL